jgi:hypothetical protein
MLVVVALVALCYCGGKYCPSILRQNKEMLLGVVVGIALCSFMDMRLEGMTGMASMDALVARPGRGGAEGVVRGGEGGR